MVNGADVTPSNGTLETQDASRKWKIKAGKALFVLKATIQRDMLEHIHDVKTPKEVWDSFASLFSKTNNVRLQMLENEIGSISQGGMSISEYFLKVKGICHDITQLDEESKITDARKRRITIRGLKPEYNGFVTDV